MKIDASQLTPNKEPSPPWKHDASTRPPRKPRLLPEALRIWHKERKKRMTYQNLDLSSEWDKTFPQSDKVHHEKVAFDTSFGHTLAADLYRPKGSDGPFAAIAVSGPFGAVKEQASGLYAQSLAERGFLTIAFDPSYTGESGGEPRYMASPDINTDDFMSAVDYLTCRSDVDAERIGIVGICGWGGIALNAAASDPRIKATVASTMYDMTRVGGNGYFDEQDSADARNAARRAMAAERTREARSGERLRAGGVADVIPEGAPEFLHDYWDYYKTPRGYASRSLNSNDGWDVTGTQAYADTRFLTYIDEIEAPAMVMHGEHAHSLYMGKAAYEKMAAGPYGGNKRLVIVPGAVHCDLYDGGDGGFIDWEMLAGFFDESLPQER